MRRIEQRLEPLQPVGADDPAVRLDVAVGELGELVVGEARRRLGRAHVDPHQPAGLVRRMAAHRHAGGEALALGARLGRRVDALALDAELPAVEHAPQAVLLVARERQAGAAVRAGFLHEPDAAVGGAEGDEVLAEQAHLLGRAVGLEPGRAARRDPVFAQHRAHRRARPDPRQQLVVGLVHHRRGSSSASWRSARPPPRLSAEPSTGAAGFVKFP